MTIRSTLNNLYLDYTNNYLTIAKFAEHNLIDLHAANCLIDLGRKINNQGVNFEHDIKAMTY